ncbi:MAG: hypothetical protein ACOY3D_06085 [Candidatus Omnitrophota bacterium]
MRLRWKIYAIIFALSVAANTYFSLNEDLPIYNYYQLLLFLDREQWLRLVFYYFTNIIEAVSLVPLFLFAFGINGLSRDFWKTIFIGRIIGLIWGHNFEYNLISALAHSSLRATIFAVGITVLFSLPSYAAQFIYSFRRK